MREKGKVCDGKNGKFINGISVWSQRVEVATKEIMLSNRHAERSPSRYSHTHTRPRQYSHFKPVALHSRTSDKCNSLIVCILHRHSMSYTSTNTLHGFTMMRIYRRLYAIYLNVLHCNHIRARCFFIYAGAQRICILCARKNRVANGDLWYVQYGRAHIFTLIRIAAHATWKFEGVW